MVCRAASWSLVLLGLAVSGRADSFVWGGGNGSFSDPASWLDVAPVAPGAASQQLFFPVSDLIPPYTAMIDVSWTLNSLGFTSQRAVTLSALPGAGLYFDGANPSITHTGDASYSNVIIDAPISTSSSLLFDGRQTYVLTGPLVSTGNGELTLSNGASVIYQNNAAPIGFSQTTLNAGMDNGRMTWNVTVADSSPVHLSFGSGPIVSAGGWFAIDLMAQSQLDSVSATLSNAFNVQGYMLLGITAETVVPPALYTPGDYLSYSNALGMVTPVSSATVNFTGPITLGGQLGLFPNAYAPTGVPAKSSVLELSGRITLDQSSLIDLGIGSWGYSPNQRVMISGEIVDDPDPAHAGRFPLALSVMPFDASNLLTITGTHNTYSTGTIILFGSITVGPGATLGTGPIRVESMAALRLTSAANLNAGQSVLLEGGPDAVLSLGFDAAPYAFLNPTSVGTLAIDTAFRTPLDMSRLGDGRMYLGSTAHGTYDADSLRPNGDHAYLLGGNLTLTRSVLADYDGVASSVVLKGGTVAAANSYSGGTTVTGDATAAAAGALGSGDVSVANYGDFGWHGTLSLSAPNAYLPTARVDVFGTLAAIGPAGAVPFTNAAPIFHPGSALILGDNLFNNSDRYPDAMAIKLDGGILVLKGVGTTSEEVGPIAVSNVATILLWNPGSGSNLTTLTAASINREGHGVLYVIPGRAASNLWDSNVLPWTPSGTNSANLQVLDAPEVRNGMVAPWIQTRSTDFGNHLVLLPQENPPSFLGYGASGFSLPTYVAMPSGAGDSTQVVDVPFVSGDLLISGSKSIWALRTASGILSNDAVMPTVQIGSGGLIGDSDLMRGRPGLITIQANVDLMNAEACVNVQVPELVISGIVTGNRGVTKFGSGTLQLPNPANQLRGPLTILEGGLEWAGPQDGSFTETVALSAGARIRFLDSTVLSGPVVISGGGAGSGSGSEENGTTIAVAPGQTLTIATPIHAVGANLWLGDINRLGGSLRIMAPITSDTRVRLTSPHISLESTIASPSLDLSVGAAGTLDGSGTLSCPNYIEFGPGTVAPGIHPGDIGAMVVDSPSFELFGSVTLAVDLDAAGHSDRVLVVGGLYIWSGVAYGMEPSVLALHFAGAPEGATYTLVSASQIDGTFDSVTGLPAGYAVEYTANSILLVPTTGAEVAVPEAGSGLLFLAAPLLLRRRRR